MLLAAPIGAEACLMGEGTLTQVWADGSTTTLRGVASGYVRDDIATSFVFNDEAYVIDNADVISAPVSPQCQFDLTYLADPISHSSFE